MTLTLIRSTPAKGSSNCRTIVHRHRSRYTNKRNMPRQADRKNTPCNLCWLWVPSTPRPYIINSDHNLPWRVVIINDQDMYSTSKCGHLTIARFILAIVMKLTQPHHRSVSTTIDVMAKRKLNARSRVNWVYRQVKLPRFPTIHMITHRPVTTNSKHRISNHRNDKTTNQNTNSRNQHM